MERGAVQELPRKDILTEWWSEVKENFWECQAKVEMSAFTPNRTVRFL